MDPAAFLNIKTKTVILEADKNLSQRLYAVFEYGDRFLGESIVYLSFPGIVEIADDWTINLVVDKSFFADYKQQFSNDELLVIPYVKDQQH